MRPVHFFHSLGIFLSALGFAWLINVSAGFFYPAWYELLSIDNHIKKYAPQNRFNRQSFVLTSDGERKRLFKEISDSVSFGNPSELSRLKYNYRNSSQVMLRSKEVEHLEHVSTLVKGMTGVSAAIASSLPKAPAG